MPSETNYAADADSEVLKVGTCFMEWAKGSPGFVDSQPIWGRDAPLSYPNRAIEFFPDRKSSSSLRLPSAREIDPTSSKQSSSPRWEA